MSLSAPKHNPHFGAGHIAEQGWTLGYQEASGTQGCHCLISVSRESHLCREPVQGPCSPTLLSAPSSWFAARQLFPNGKATRRMWLGDGAHLQAGPDSTCPSSSFPTMLPRCPQPGHSPCHQGLESSLSHSGTEGALGFGLCCYPGFSSLSGALCLTYLFPHPQHTPAPSGAWRRAGQGWKMGQWRNPDKLARCEPRPGPPLTASPASHPFPSLGPEGGLLSRVDAGQKRRIVPGTASGLWVFKPPQQEVLESLILGGRGDLGSCTRNPGLE